MNLQVFYQDCLKKLAVAFDHKIIENARNFNPWFISRFISDSIDALSSLSMNNNTLQDHAAKSDCVFYCCEDNIPLESLTDILLLLSSGNKVIYRLPAKNDRLMETALNYFMNSNPALSDLITLTDKPFSEAGVYITDHNISDENVKKYFKGKPVFKKAGLYSVAVLSGNEMDESLEKLSGDILIFFGKGKGNVKKVFVPENYDFDLLFRALEKYYFVKDNHHYYNRYQYSQSMYLLNNEKFLDNNFFIIKEDSRNVSPTGVLYFETYNNPEKLSGKLFGNNNFYSVYSDQSWLRSSMPFGSSVNISIEPDKNLTDFITGISR